MIFRYLKFVPVLLCFLFTEVEAQIHKPVKWSFETHKNAEGVTLVFTAKIEKGWHVYSQFIEEGGPVATTFNFEKSEHYELIGKTSEGKPEEAFDQSFGMTLKYFSNKAVFKQKINVKSEKNFKLKGTLSFMVCNDKMCLPPEDKEFTFNINPVAESKELKDTVDLADVKAEHSDSSKSIVKENSGTGGETSDKSAAGMSLLSIFLGGFIGGFLALLTPCVFPMIPLTVSFFTKKDHSRVKGAFHAGIYGMSIIVIYVFLGFVVTKLLGADALNNLASNGIFNMVFFLLLVVFAISFLGAFEITLPSSWVNKADSKSERGGLLGIFFMAFTLALVSFSCTGPIIGTLLVQAASGKSTLGPLIGMLGFSLALALPFAIFAAFPSMMKSLPKSGGWLNSVKVVLGFLELALALKFLSNVDLAYHWGILDRDIFLVLWIIIFSMLGFYLLGKLKFSHDSDLKYISIPRLLLAMFSLSFALYMVPGLWGAPYKGALSAFLPPESTQDFDLNRFSSTTISEVHSIPKKHTETFHCPHNLSCFFDYEEGMQYAKKVNKPVFIDFTGWTCVNCRQMEASVWSDPQVLKRLNEDYVLISLYVDDKTTLPESEQYISKFSGNKVKTLGNKWSDLQSSRFGTNSQPYYVLLNHKEELLTEPHAFDLNIKNYIRFLDLGKEKFK